MPLEQKYSNSSFHGGGPSTAVLFRLMDLKPFRGTSKMHVLKLYASSHSRDTEATAPWWNLKIDIFYNAKVILILG